MNEQAALVRDLARGDGPVEGRGRGAGGHLEDDVIAPEQAAEGVVELGDPGGGDIALKHESQVRSPVRHP